MKEILTDIEKSINLGNELQIKFPTDPRIKVMLLSLEELKKIFLKSSIDLERINQMCYGITRILTEMLEFEKPHLV